MQQVINWFGLFINILFTYDDDYDDDDDDDEDGLNLLGKPFER